MSIAKKVTGPVSQIIGKKITPEYFDQTGKLKCSIEGSDETIELTVEPVTGSLYGYDIDSAVKELHELAVDIVGEPAPKPKPVVKKKTTKKAAPVPAPEPEEDDTLTSSLSLS